MNEGGFDSKSRCMDNGQGERVTVHTSGGDEIIRGTQHVCTVQCAVCSRTSSNI